MRLSDHLAETPVVREGDDGLLHIDWPRYRPTEFVIAAEMFDALVCSVNLERLRADAIAKAARHVVQRWEADEVDDGAMGREVAVLRDLIEGVS